MGKVKTIEEGLKIVNHFEGLRSIENLLVYVEKKVVLDLCLMGYIRKGGTVIDKRPIETWTVTPLGREEYGYDEKRLSLDDSDLALLEFYNQF